MNKQIELLRKATNAEVVLMRVMGTEAEAPAAEEADKAWKEFEEFALKHTKLKESK